MNGGTNRSSGIGGSNRPVGVQGMNVLVNGCQLLFGYERVPGLTQFIERYTDFGFNLWVESVSTKVLWCD